jgi:tRNA (guanine10-N2)-methyltransferase
MPSDFDIFTNFDHYNLPRPEIFVQDIRNSMLISQKFDAIICDPPYGIRARSRRLMHKAKDSFDVH